MLFLECFPGKVSNDVCFEKLKFFPDKLFVLFEFLLMLRFIADPIDEFIELTLSDLLLR